MNRPRHRREPERRLPLRSAPVTEWRSPSGLDEARGSGMRNKGVGVALVHRPCPRATREDRARPPISGTGLAARLAMPPASFRGENASGPTLRRGPFAASPAITRSASAEQGGLMTH